VRALVAAGEPVRAAVLDPARDAARLPTGVECVRLDFADPATFAAAVEGVRGLFLLRPPAVARVGPTLNRLIDVAAAAGVEHCVFLSVAGAERNVMVPHHRVERHLSRDPIGWTILRPSFFAQNLTSAYRDDIRSGRIVVPAGDRRVAFVDSRDLADVAALVFQDPSRHRRSGYLLTGPEALTFACVAELLTRALGRAVRYEAASVRGYLAHLRRQGLPGVQAAVQTVLHTGLRFGQAETVDPTLGQLLRRPPGTMAAFVADHLGEFDAA